MESYLLLYNHCIIVNGASRSSILDLQRNKVHLIPNAFANLFEDGRFINVTGLVAELDHEDQKILNEYLQFLDEVELAFYCSERDLVHFPKLAEEWLFPAHISNCVLDCLNECKYFTDAFLHQLNDLCCNFIQFRFYGNPSITYLNTLIAQINRSQIKSVEILMPGQDYEEFEHEIIDFVERNRKLSMMTIYGMNENSILNEGVNGMGILYKSKEKITGVSHCGIIGMVMFSINIPTYTESLKNNTCLNRKISIDVNGNIKNCPSMPDSFGNISDTSLQEAIDKPKFKQYWNLTKDDIMVCKDCEFRHVCTDCRAYLENPEEDRSKPLKCGYNPYTCEWEEWSINPLKQKAIQLYGVSLQ